MVRSRQACDNLSCAILGHRMSGIVAELAGTSNEEGGGDSKYMLLQKVRNLLGIEDGHLTETVWTGGMTGKSIVPRCLLIIHCRRKVVGVSSGAQWGCKSRERGRVRPGEAALSPSARISARLFGRILPKLRQPVFGERAGEVTLLEGKGARQDEIPVDSLCTYGRGRIRGCHATLVPA